MIKYDVLEPATLSDHDWRRVQNIARQAFFYALPPARSMADISKVTGTGDLDRYIQTRKDPNTAIGDAFKAAQTYYNPRVAIARHGRDIVGFASAADNVSGSKLAQAIKRRSPAKQYLWFREIAVDPEFQGSGIAKELGRHMLSSSDMPEQPVSAFVWPAELPSAVLALQSLGFEQRGEASMEHIYGTCSEPVEQIMLVAPSVREVQERLA